MYNIIEIQDLNPSSTKMADLAKKTAKNQKEASFIVVVMKIFSKILQKSCQFLIQISKICIAMYYIIEI